MKSNNQHEAIAIVQEIKKIKKQVAFAKLEVVKMDRSGWIWGMFEDKAC